MIYKKVLNICYEFTQFEQNIKEWPVIDNEATGELVDKADYDKLRHELIEVREELDRSKVVRDSLVKKNLELKRQIVDHEE